jgi:hypothetical protein
VGSVEDFQVRTGVLYVLTLNVCSIIHALKCNHLALLAVVIIKEHTGLFLGMAPEMIVIVAVTATATCGFCLCSFTCNCDERSTVLSYAAQCTALYCAGVERSSSFIPFHALPLLA